AARELLEETGVDAPVDELASLMQLDLGEGRTLAVHLWRAADGIDLVPTASSDCLGTVWLTLDAILAMPDSTKTPRLDEVMKMAEESL
ncbi:MAG: NUDIX domain-containing protein, partial [Pseudomonadota bacterium]